MRVKQFPIINVDAEAIAGPTCLPGAINTSRVAEIKTRLL